MIRCSKPFVGCCCPTVGGPASNTQTARFVRLSSANVPAAAAVAANSASQSRYTTRKMLVASCTQCGPASSGSERIQSGKVAARAPLRASAECRESSFNETRTRMEPRKEAQRKQKRERRERRERERGREKERLWSEPSESIQLLLFSPHHTLQHVALNLKISNRPARRRRPTHRRRQSHRHWRASKVLAACRWPSAVASNKELPSAATTTTTTSTTTSTSTNAIRSAQESLC